jgi:hypothetical protein
MLAGRKGFHSKVQEGRNVEAEREAERDDIQNERR